MSTAQRRYRIGRAPGARAIALALAGLLAGGGQMTQAAPRAPVDPEAAAAKAAAKDAAAKVLAEAKEAAAKEAAAAQAGAHLPIHGLEGGAGAGGPKTPNPGAGGAGVVGQKTPENARKEGLTVIDLSDDWLPYVFS